ncbi:MAG: metalloprotease family protein [Clostridia bacterium]
MLDIFIAITIQLLLVVVSFVVFGFVIFFVNKLFYKVLKPKSKIGVYATAFVGVPIHELSHALMCIVFGCRISEIKLFQMDDESGVLGYVVHEGATWRNPYKMIGQFFIGIAPLFCGGMLIYLLYFLLMSNSFWTLSAFFADFFAEIEGGDDYLQLLMIYFDGMLFTFENMFSAENFSSILFYVFLAISMCISLHMTLSGADIKNSTAGLAFIIVLSLVVNTILYFAYPQGMYYLTKVVLKGSSFIIVCMTLAVALSLFAVVLAAGFDGSKKLIGAIKNRCVK